MITCYTVDNAGCHSQSEESMVPKQSRVSGEMPIVKFEFQQSLKVAKYDRSEITF